MSNRFHNKWHRKNHHTYGNASNPDAAHDPIASQNQPFLGEFVLQGALCAVAPMSAFAGYFYSNFTGLCAFAGYRAIQAKAFNFPGGDSIGIQVDSQNIAISAYAPFIGLNSYSMTNAISAYGKGRGAFIGSDIKGAEIQGGSIGAEVYSTNKAISANGFLMGAEIYSNRRAISAYGSLIGAEIYGVGRALSAMSPNLGIEVYSDNRAISAYGTNIGAEVASPNVAISAYSPKIAIRAYAPIYTQNNNGVRALDVRGFSFFDGDVTISGNLTAAGALTYLDTRVQITSSLYVKNAGTDTAFTVIQEGATDVVNIQDDEATALYILNGGNVGIGTNAPAANLHVVDIRDDSNPEVRIQARTSNSFDPTLRLIGTGSTTDGLTIKYDNSVNDVYINNGATPSNNIAYRVSTAADTDSVVIFNTGNVGINAITPIDDAKLNIAGDSTSSNIALSASAPTLAASFYSPIMALSANGSHIGAIIRSPNLALRVTGATEINNNSAESGVPYPVNINSIYSTGNVNIGNSTGNLVLSGNRFDLRTVNPVFINTDAGEIFNLNTGTGAAVNINTGTGAVTTQIGNAGTVDIDGTSVILDSTSQVSINTNASTAITNIGIGSTTGKITIGNTGLTDGVELDGSPIDINVNTANSNATRIGTGSTTGAVSIGNTTGQLSLSGGLGYIRTWSTLNINNETARTTNINTGGGAVTTQIGNVGTVDIDGATLTLDSTTSTSINNNDGTATTNIGTGSTTGKITIGNTGLTGGIELDGSPIDINVSAGAYATNINTGTSTGTTTIGNTAATVVVAGSTSINASVNDNTNINTGSSTGTTTIGNAAATVVVAGSTSINASINDATNINTGTSTGTTTIGNGSNTTTINSATTNINSTTIEIGDANTDTVNINAGPVNFPSATSAADGLVIGADTNLYRSAANTLKTNDSFIVQTNLTVNGNTNVVGPLITPAPVTVNAATKTVATTETSLIFTTTNCTVTLPSVATYIGRWLFFKNVTANSVISSGATDILPLNSSTPTNAILAATAGKWAWIQSDGTNWVIMAAN